MYKELIISIIIIASIFSLDFILDKHTSESIDNIYSDIYELKKTIRDNEADSKEIENKTENLYKEWKEYNQKLSFYIEHNELEKVETTFVSSKSFIDSKQYGDAISELEKTAFILEHIKDKYSFNLINIF